MIDTSESIAEIATSLSKLQGALESAKRTTKAYQYNYADLKEVWGVIQAPLADNGLSIFQAPYNTPEGNIGVETLLLHSSGQWIKSRFDSKFIATGKNVAQDVGSMITYYRRYGLMAALGVSPEDDDAQSLPKYPANQQTRQAPAKKTAPAQISRSGIPIMMFGFDEVKGKPLNQLTRQQILKQIKWAKESDNDFCKSQVPSYEAWLKQNPNHK